jgi:hypothetical protein
MNETVTELNIQPEQSQSQAAILAAAGAGFAILGLFALIELFYSPPPYPNPHSLGSAPLAAGDFRAAFGLPPTPHAPADAFTAAFKTRLYIIWISYGFMLLGLFHRKNPLPIKPVLALIAGVAVVVAVVCPPILTGDPYAYIGYARIAVTYGHNPYSEAPITFLQAHHEALAGRLAWNIPIVYGPLWTILSIILTAPLKFAGLWPQLVAMKLIEAVALVLAAVAGRGIAEHLQPGRGAIALLAIGLNPVLLLEGPGMGHNDLLLVALLLTAAFFQLKGKLVPAGLFLGLAIAVKVIALVALPWMLFELCRGKTLPAKAKLACALTALAILPTLIGYIPFWHGADTFTGVVARGVKTFDATGAAHQEAQSKWLVAHGVGGGALRPALALVSHWQELVLFLILTGMLLARRRVSIWFALAGPVLLVPIWLDNDQMIPWVLPIVTVIAVFVLTGKLGDWLIAWGLLTILFMTHSMGIPFPWYLCWFWPFFLVQWDRRHIVLSSLIWMISLIPVGWYSLAFADTLGK